MCSLTAAKYLLEKGAMLLPGMLCAVRCGRAAAAGGEGNVLQRQTELLFISV